MKICMRPRRNRAEQATGPSMGARRSSTLRAQRQSRVSRWNGPAGAFLMALIVQLPSFALGAECKLARLVELPVTMDGARPTITAQINGTDALFALDSGAFWSMLTPAAAEQYK